MSHQESQPYVPQPSDLSPIPVREEFEGFAHLQRVFTSEIVLDSSSYSNGSSSIPAATAITRECGMVAVVAGTAPFFGDSVEPEPVSYVRLIQYFYQGDERYEVHIRPPGGGKLFEKVFSLRRTRTEAIADQPESDAQTKDPIDPKVRLADIIALTTFTKEAAEEAAKSLRMPEPLAETMDSAGPPSDTIEEIFIADSATTEKWAREAREGISRETGRPIPQPAAPERVAGFLGKILGPRGRSSQTSE